MMANVASVACLLFNIVAIMHKPFSVKALGKALVFANFVVENFDRKSANSPSLISNLIGFLNFIVLRGGKEDGARRSPPPSQKVRRNPMDPSAAP
jgi:hypothetical protein